ncbi:MAG: host attachment protein [Candidatus Omnitrophica bacterium]|nr:host attachment protein [Candidatus Omnitrophota bacterium]
MKAKLVIVSDLGLLKAFQLELRNEGSHRMKLLEELVLEPAHQHLTEQITDSAGRRAAPAGNMGAGTMADDHNLQLEIRRRLIKALARKIEAIAQAHPLDSLWLAVNKEIFRPISEMLPPAVLARIERQVPCDLTKLEPQDVLGHFLAFTPPVGP